MPWHSWFRFNTNVYCCLHCYCFVLQVNGVSVLHKCHGDRSPAGAMDEIYRVGNNMSYDFDYRGFMSQYAQNQSDPDKLRRDMLTYYVVGIGGMVVCCLGLIGNILSICVLTRPNMRTSTYSYLCALSVCDSLVLFFTAILLIKDLSKPGKDNRLPWDEGMYPYIFPYVHPMAFTFQVTSIWLTLAFTVDRYIMICHPFKAEPYCTVSRARKVICILYIAGIIFNIPKYFEYETVETWLPLLNRTLVNCDLTTFGKSAVFRQLYHSWFYITFVCGVPFLTLAVLNMFLMRAVLESRKKGREINVAEKKRNDTTVMLISVVVVFFICQMPALVSRTIWAFVDVSIAFKKLSLYTLNEIGNFLIVLNSAINIVPYYFFGRRFRRQFLKLFCHCLLGYKKFQKLSRSYSATMIDTRRTSNVSANVICQPGHTFGRVPDKYELQKYQKGNCLVVPPVSRPIPRLSTDSGVAMSTPANGGEYECLRNLSSEVNGNCLVHKLEPYDDCDGGQSTSCMETGDAV